MLDEPVLKLLRIAKGDLECRSCLAVDYRPLEELRRGLPRPGTEQAQRLVLETLHEIDIRLLRDDCQDIDVVDSYWIVGALAVLIYGETQTTTHLLAA